MKVKFSCEVAYDNFLVSFRAKLTAPLCNNKDVACVFVQKHSCRTKLCNWLRLYLHRMAIPSLLYAFCKILHQVRTLQCFQAASYFCIEWGEIVIVAWFGSQWFILLEHAPQRMPVWAVQRWCSAIYGLSLNYTLILLVWLPSMKQVVDVRNWRCLIP